MTFTTINKAFEAHDDEKINFELKIVLTDMLIIAVILKRRSLPDKNILKYAHMLMETNF